MFKRHDDIWEEWKEIQRIVDLTAEFDILPMKVYEEAHIELSGIEFYLEEYIL